MIISCASEDQMKELLPIVFQRIGQLFPLESFQKNVQKMIEVKTLAIFHKWPSFVISQKVNFSFFFFFFNLKKKKRI